MPSLRPGPVRPLFRALAWVLGPLLMGSGVLMAILDLRGVTASGWPAWSRQLHTGLWLGIGNLAIGWIVFSAGRTGRDPYVVTDEDTSERGTPDR
ncbi:MAG: hypothetical protein ACREOQ_06940 [Gemmatimonadales bacterium]